MWLMYVDDSGSLADPKQSYFVLAGVAIFERQPYWLSKKLDDVAKTINLDEPHLVELHGSPMITGNKRWRKVEKETRVNAVMDALRVFATSHPGNTAFGITINKHKYPGRNVIDFAFEQIPSRFDNFLGRLHKNGDTQRGIVIFDNSDKEAHFQGLATKFRTAGHSFGALRNLAEIPLFIDSKQSRLVQLADLIAYSIFRHVEHEDSRFFNIFKDRFDQHGGVLHGYRHYNPIEPED